MLFQEEDAENVDLPGKSLLYKRGASGAAFNGQASTSTVYTFQGGMACPNYLMGAHSQTLNLLIATRLNTRN